MGRPGRPIYGDADLGSAIEDVEKVIAKIKTNDIFLTEFVSFNFCNNFFYVFNG